MMWPLLWGLVRGARLSSLPLATCHPSWRRPISSPSSSPSSSPVFSYPPPTRRHSSSPSSQKPIPSPKHTCHSTQREQSSRQRFLSRSFNNGAAPHKRTTFLLIPSPRLPVKFPRMSAGGFSLGTETRPAGSCRIANSRGQSSLDWQTTVLAATVRAIWQRRHFRLRVLIATARLNTPATPPLDEPAVVGGSRTIYFRSHIYASSGELLDFSVSARENYGVER